MTREQDIWKKIMNNIVLVRNLDHLKSWFVSLMGCLLFILNLIFLLKIAYLDRSQNSEYSVKGFYAVTGNFDILLVTL